MAMFLTKCLNSMCCATFVSRPLNLQNLKTLLLRRLVYGVAQVCAGSLALPEDLSGAKKKEGPTWETHDWPVISCNESCVTCPPPRLPCCCLLVGLGGGPFLPLVVVD